MLSKLEKLRRQTIMKNHNILKNKYCNCKSKSMGLGKLGTTSFNTNNKSTIIIQNEKGEELHRIAAKNHDGLFGIDSPNEVSFITLGNKKKELEDARNLTIIKPNGDTIDFEGMKIESIICDAIHTLFYITYSDFYKKQPDGKVIIGSTTQTMP